MRITDRYQSLMERTGAGGKAGAARSTEKTEKVEKAREAARVNGQNRDVINVQVSDRAKELAAGGRVAELRAAVQNGAFKVDADAIAARLVGEDS